MANWTDNEFVNGLLLGSRIDDNNISYFLDDSTGAWTSVEIAAVRTAFDAWEHVADISVTRTFDQASADLVETTYLGENSSALGSHGVIVAYGSEDIVEHDVTLNGQFNYVGYGWDYEDPSGGLGVGGFGHVTLLHEFGHALGLDHTHSDTGDDPHSFPGVDEAYDLGDNEQNHMINSVMSYIGGSFVKPLEGGDSTDNYGYASGPMAYDIAAIQYLYGANLTANAGNDTYVLPDTNAVGTFFTSIWDVGGTDTITYGGTKDTEISLVSAFLQNEANGGGAVSQADGIYGGFTIAGDFTNALADIGGESGVIIENASGGSGNDTLIGNAVANEIWGNAGNDKVYAGQGDDVVHLGEGHDYVRVGGGVESFDGGSGKDYISYYYSSNGVNINLATDVVSGSWASNDTISGFESVSGSRTGNDTIYGTSGSNTIRTYGGNDKVFAGVGTDVVYLGTGNDYVRVGGGTETFHGGSGKDYISYYSSSNGVNINLATNVVSGSWATNDTISGFESASGSRTGNDTISGTSGANTIRTYGGDDILNGLGGDDLLFGGDGSDLLFGGAGGDVFHIDHGDGQDTIKDFEDDLDTIQLDNFVFAPGQDAFDFAVQSGADVVFDFGGNDILTVENATIAQLTNDLELV